MKLKFELNIPYALKQAKRRYKDTLIILSMTTGISEKRLKEIMNEKGEPMSFHELTTLNAIK